MTKRGVIGLISVVAGGAVVMIANHIANKGEEVALKKVKENRSDSVVGMFYEYEDVKNQTDKILTRERDEEEKQTRILRTAYHEANRKVQDILDKEKVLAQADYDSVSTAVDAAEVKVASILAHEEALIKDILKNDESYQALKTARKSLKKAEASTDKIDERIEKYKESMKEKIITSRSDADSKAVNDLQRLRKQMLDSDGRMEGIIANRTKAEQSAFKELERCRKELAATNVKKSIIANRTAEENRLFDLRSELLTKVSEIEAGEKESIDRKQAFANQLVSMGFGKASVFVVGLVPTIPVAVGVFTYISWLVDLVKKM